MNGFYVGDKVKVYLGAGKPKTGVIEDFTSTCPFVAAVIVKDDKTSKRMTVDFEKLTPLD